MKKNILYIILIGALIIPVLLFMIFLSKSFSRSDPAPEPRKVTFGVWNEGFYDPIEEKLRPEKILEFESMVGRKVAIAHYYLGWEALVKEDLLNQFEIIDSHSWQPMLNVNPYYFDGCPATDSPLYRAIAEGRCDDFIREAARNLSKIKKPFFLVFAWEMNNWQNEWSISKTGSTNEDFIAAWRHMRNIFNEEKADKVIWVFCPNVPEETNFPYQEIYPGNEYVDWVGLDGYNWGITQEWSEWVDFAGVFAGSYSKLTIVAPGKPLVIAEFNTTDKGGDKAGWFRDALVDQIPENFPNIKALVIFNEDRTGTERVNWKVEADRASLEAFKEAISIDVYK